LSIITVGTNWRFLWFRPGFWAQNTKTFTSASWYVDVVDLC